MWSYEFVTMTVQSVKVIVCVEYVKAGHMYHHETPLRVTGIIFFHLSF